MQNKVFGIGLSKTGTTSLYLALCQLGYRTATFRHLKRLKLNEWMNGDFSQDYLEGFSAATDLPIATWYRELDERYPGSKFILTERPCDDWLRSAKRQFEAAPDPDTFNRECRLIQYGIGVFNEERFRRIQQEHSDSVRAYFINRTEDLLTMNLFEGDGWKELCAFLGRNQPKEDFPNAKPGARPEAGKVRPHYEPEERNALAFIIPVIHPGSSKVKSFEIIERVLRYSITSCMAQRGGNVFAIVVCNEAPDWAQALPPEWRGRVFFLTLNDHPAFTANRNEGRIDMGMKFLIGGIFAIAQLKARWVMRLDGDDYVHTDLAATVFAKGTELKGDGFALRRGIHVRLVPNLESATAFSATKVNDFDLTCGSSRIFHSRPFASILESLDPAIFRHAEHIQDCDQGIIPIPTQVADEIDEVVWPVRNMKNSPVRLLGRHVRQEPHISLTPINDLLVAKGCGHGNHAGSRGGDIHWHRSAGPISPAKFVVLFGLSQTNISVAPAFWPRRMIDALKPAVFTECV